ncbi:tyrosine-type recombinase/integrase [Bacteroides uniformis]|uniref:Integrase n=8 Tax=Bacteroides uniformis TaxID=820 RepID=A0A412SQ08_BACUN|nr:tyrosine-type recombinase/integrase [Bacteroides uniformis]EFV26535.1 tyrosine type site-specific recombinase [Bacteroides sp. 4_1_36]RJW89454.1 integrase [Bacteroides sp. AF35-22]KAB3913640.1 tyrosine-type recombinase/integrase [Bacteroides uniformis]KAB3914209.1 tyrosine-type recombinase/integrase [Bacteroides uniformis]KAB3915947.1 tyrosine-type recombinase/integrase [Bacteroides uniformis]
MPSFPKQAANSLVTETSQYFVFFCRSVCSAILAKCLIINVLRLIIVILFFIAFLNITYAARHTWATLAFHAGMSIGIISKALGHFSIKVTETYLKPFENEKVDAANEELIISVAGYNEKKVA